MSGTLPTWLEQLLRLETVAGEGIAWRLVSHWPWPPWLTLLAMIAAVLFVVAIYLRENRQAARPYRMVLAGIRITLVAMVLGMIAQLTLSLERTGLPFVAVVIDDTLSMTILDHYDESERAAVEKQITGALSSKEELSRWNLARALLTEDDGSLLANLGENYKLRFYYLSGVRPSRQTDVPAILEEIRGTKATGETTRLGGAVRTILDELRGTAPAAIALVTDGINTEGPSLADAALYARRKDVPLFFIGVGSDRPVRDLKLSDLLVDDVVFVNDIVSFQFKLTASGFAGQKIPIVLRREGKSEILAQIEVTVGRDGQSQEVRLPYRPTEVGQFAFSIEARPPEGSLQTANNRLQRTIQVRKEKIRVLLAQAYPSFEYRFLRNMLARDETIELHTLLQDADREYVEQDKTALGVFPIRREEIFAYDVIILGDLNPALLSPASLQHVADFVDQPGKGGALVLIGGPQYMPQAFRDTPLARLLPFDIQRLRYPDPTKPLTDGFVVAPTELGLASPPMQLANTPEQSRSIWQGLAPLYWLIEIPELRPARILAEHPTRLGADGRRLPVILMQYVGAGKILFHATDESWRWHRGSDDLYFSRYWIQMIRYVSRSKLADGNRVAELTTDRRGDEYRLGDPVRLRVRFNDERQAPPEEDGVAVVVEHQGNQTERIRLHRVESGGGIFETELRRLPMGAYHAWVAAPALEGRAPAADFRIQPPAGEFARVQMDAREMRQAAETSKGRFYTAAQAEHLLADLPEGRQVPMETLPSLPLWNQWPVIAFFLILLIAEWLLRKRGGMV